MMFQIQSDLKKLLASLSDAQQPITQATYQNAYLRFRGFVADHIEHSEVYREWASRYLLDVSDETGEVVKLHESNEELKADIEAFIKLIERNEEIPIH
jgi:hypothetical protein